MVKCLVHTRSLELACKDALKSSSLYGKVITLLNGLFSFYMQRSGLIENYTALKIKVAIPTRIGGIRWLPHICLAL